MGSMPSKETLRFASPPGGVMAGLVAAKDWSATPLGPIEGWSASLRMAVG